MKTRISVIILLLALLLAACQGAPAPATTAPQEQAPQENAPENSEEYPEPSVQNEEAIPGDTYPNPNPAIELPTDPGPYPGPEGGETVEWQAAVDLINSGQVVQVFQSHDLTVTMTLADGRTVVTTEPAIDEVLNVIEQCGEACSNIEVATE